MLRRTRLRAALLQFGLWVLMAAMIGYFGYHGVHGDRGLTAHRTFEAQIASLNEELSRVQDERKEIERRIARLEPSSVDRDMLDEQARRSLGWLHPNDRLIELP